MVFNRFDPNQTYLIISFLETVCSHRVFHVLLPFVGVTTLGGTLKVFVWKKQARLLWYTFRHFFDCFLTCYVDSMDMMWSKLWDSLSLCRIFWNKHHETEERSKKIIDALSQIVSPPPKFQNFSHENLNSQGDFKTISNDKLSENFLSVAAKKKPSLA